MKMFSGANSNHEPNPHSHQNHGTHVSISFIKRQ